MTRTFPEQFHINSYLVPLPLAVFPGGIFVLEKLEGYVVGAGPAYLQLFDLAATASLASGTTVPFRSMQLQGTDGFLWQYGDDNLLLPELQNGLVIAISSTDSVFTTYASTMNLAVSMAEWELQYQPNATAQAVTTVGDLTSAVNHLSVWNNAAGYHTLLTSYIINGNTSTVAGGQDLYLMLFPTDAAPTAGTFAIQSWLIPPQNSVSFVNGTLALNFGQNSGTIPRAYDPKDTTQGIQETGTLLNGCFLQVSKTGGFYTAITGGQTVTIKATYV